MQAKSTSRAAAVGSSDLVLLVIAGHGGRERFGEASEIVIRGRAGGLAQRSKRWGRILGDFEVRCSTREQLAEFSSYPGKGKRGIFDRSGVRIESSEDGAVLAQRGDPRSVFPGGRRLLWWDELDFLYFAGYAMWGYATVPFTFEWPGVESREIEPWEEDGEWLRRLEVTFPREMHVHSRRQVYYFDKHGLLRRIDYSPEVFGSWVQSAHYADEHQIFDGLVVPTRRRVYGRKRNNRARRFPTFVWIDVSGAEVR